MVVPSPLLAASVKAEDYSRQQSLSLGRLLMARTVIEMELKGVWSENDRLEHLRASLCLRSVLVERNLPSNLAMLASVVLVLFGEAWEVVP